MKIFTTIVLGLLSLGAYSQQDAGFSMYFFNPVYMNPGYAGSREEFSGTLLHRSQWVGMNGAPMTQSLSMHSALPNSRVGLGLQVYNDRIGPMKNTGINMTYAYHLPINESTTLSFGLTGKLNILRVVWGDMNVQDPNDPSFTNSVPSNWVPDAGAGLYLYKTRFFCGLSVNHIMQSKFGMSNSPSTEFAKFYRQYYLASGIVIPISETIDFRPTVILKYVKGAPLVGEANGSFIFFQRLFVGVALRTDKRMDIKGTDNTIVGILEFEVTNFLHFGYSFDYYLNRTGSYNSGTHELMVGWDINVTKTKPSLPWYF